MNEHYSKVLFLFFLLASGLKNPMGLANAFSVTPRTSRATVVTRNRWKVPLRKQEKRLDGSLSSNPQSLSSLSDEDGSNFDNFVPDEVTKMKEVIVSLSQETNDETRRSRLKQIMEAGLAGPNGGPKRFVVLFERVLNTIGEQVQQEAREKYSERADASAAETTADEGLDKDVPTDDDDAGDLSEESASTEKSPEELKLWALVDMMVQSKTIIKKHKF